MLQLTTTPRLRFGSKKIVFLAMILGVLAPGCALEEAAQAQSTPVYGVQPTVSAGKMLPEANIGVVDKGVFSDLDSRLQLPLPTDLGSTSQAVLDPDHKVLVLYQGSWPIKVYPIGGPAELKLGSHTLALRPGDHAELLPILNSKNLQVLTSKDGVSDVDQDGIPDSLDLLMGAQKTVLNGANYGGGYRRIPYPNGDIPREDGVCTDVVVRAVRNAGVDIQSELQKDIKRKLRAYPMIKKRNPNIDHRRVKTLLPYFKRQWTAHTTEFDDPKDPLRPGDIIFMDTFPNRSGPDHIGVLSNNRGKSGQLLVINNWTNGFKTQEMDLLSFVPVTHRFRLPPQKRK